MYEVKYCTLLVSFSPFVPSAWIEGKTWYSSVVTAHVSCVETGCRSVRCVANLWKDVFYCFDEASPPLNSLPCRRFHWVRRVFDCLKPPYWIEKSGNLGLVKGKGDGGGEREIFSPLPLPRRLLSPNTNPKGFNFSPPLGVKVKDGGHGITTKTNNLLRPHCRSPLKDLIELIN